MGEAIGFVTSRTSTIRTDMVLDFREIWNFLHRHCEPTGRANARPMTGSAKQSIASSQCGGMDCFVAIAPRNDERQAGFLSRKYGSTGPWTLMVSGLP